MCLHKFEIKIPSVVTQSIRADSIPLKLIGPIITFFIVFILGNVEWTDKTKKQCLVMWRTPQEWGNLIYQWVRMPLSVIIFHFTSCQMVVN